MSNIFLLQFPDEPEFRASLTKQGISLSAQELLVADEAANREASVRLKSRAESVWNTLRAFVLLNMATKNMQPVELPSAELVAALSWAIAASELCATIEMRHPALRELSADKRGADAGDWNAAIASALLRNQPSGLKIGPTKAGSLRVLFDVPPGSGLLVRSVDIPPVGDVYLPREWLKALAIEALHRLSGTSRRYDLPAVLRVIPFAGSGPGWSLLADSMLDGGRIDGLQPDKPVEPTVPPIILPQK